MLVHEASTRPDRVVCVVGAAGAGKTTALRLLADAHRESGVPVLGAAPSGRAADELAAGAGIATRTMHRLLLDAQADGGLPHGCVLVVDEAGMAETRVLAPLLDLVAAGGGEGDPGRRPGSSCRRSTRAGSSPRSASGSARSTSARTAASTTSFERRALEQLRDGDPEPYLAHAARRGRLHIDEEPPVAKQRLLEDWWQTRRARPRTARSCSPIAAPTSATSTTPPARCSSHAGRLGPEALEAGGREFRVGDRVLCRRNDERLGVRNGIRATIVDARRRGADAADGRRRAPHAPRALRGRAPRPRLRPHRPRRPGRHRRARLRPAPRPGRTARMGLRRLHPRPQRDPPLPHQRDARPRDAHGREPDRQPTHRSGSRARSHLCRRAARARPAPTHRPARPRAPTLPDASSSNRTAPSRRTARAGRDKLDQLGWRGRRRHGAELARDRVAARSTASRR